jgi:PAS domain S-box-containing protein
LPWVGEQGRLRKRTEYHLAVEVPRTANEFSGCDIRRVWVNGIRQEPFDAMDSEETETIFPSPAHRSSGNPPNTSPGTADRHAAQAALRESERRFRLAFDHAPIGMALVRLDGRWFQVNRALCEILGYEESELLRMNFQMLTHPDDLDRGVDLARRMFGGETDRLTLEKRYIHKRGHVVWILLHASVVRNEAGEPLYSIAQIKDITEQKAAQAELESHAAENARLLEQVTKARAVQERLSRRLLTLQEEERRTIARELHDEVGQILTGLKLTLEASARTDCPPDLSQLREVTGQLLERVKDLSLDLRPPMLDDLGLVATLLWHFERYRAQTGIEVRFHHRDMKDGPARGGEIAAFRIVQEALTNVARHSGARDVNVEVWIVDRMLHLGVEDRGRGFDASAVAGPAQGIAGMRERALLAGGMLTIESSVGNGTRVAATLPLEERASWPV